MTRLVLFLLLAVASSAHGHDKSDVITMYNGDQITGEIRSLDYGELRIKTNYAQEFTLEWWHIAKIESNYTFEVSTENGRRLYGNISSSEKNGQLVFTSIDDSFVINMLAITEIRPM